MAVFSVLYPARDGARFDHDYYRDVHIPMAEAAFRPTGHLNTRIFRGVPGPGGALSPFVAMVHMTFRDAAALQASLGGPDAAAVQADVANFTDITPVIQISVEA